MDEALSSVLDTCADLAKFAVLTEPTTTNPGMHMEDVLTQLNDLAKGCQILEMEGHGDFTLGHLSLRDPDGKGFWLKRNSFGLGEIVSAKDFILVDFDGTKVSGEGGLHSEWPIHSEVFKKRPDVNVVGHTHPFYSCILSASIEPLIPFSLDPDYFIDLPRHEADVALIKTVEQGQALATSLGDAFALLIANHGALFCGRSVAHAICVAVFLEHACKSHVTGRSAGFAYTIPTLEIRRLRRSQMMTDVHVEHTYSYLRRKLDQLMRVQCAGEERLYR
jgi:L-fuculose-phosphate aldolase